MIQQEYLFHKKIRENLLKKDRDTLTNYLLLNYLNEHRLFNQIIDYKLLPYRMVLEPTTKCFLKCMFCHAPLSKRKELPNMTLETFKRIIDKLPQLLELNLQGQGEPLLNEDLFDMVEYAVAKNISVRSYTNGVLLDRENCEKIVKSGMFEFRISMDGASANTVETIRKGINYAKLIRNIKLLLKIKEKRRFPLINFWFVASKLNFREIPNLIKLANELGIDGVKIKIRLSSGINEIIAKRAKKAMVNINLKEHADILETAKNLAKNLDVYLEISNNIRSREAPCYWLWYSAFISVEGYILPCGIITDPNILNFGNILDKNISEIFYSAKYNNFRKKVLNCDIDDKHFCSPCFEIYK